MTCKSVIICQNLKTIYKKYKNFICLSSVFQSTCIFLFILFLFLEELSLKNILEYLYFATFSFQVFKGKVILCVIRN